MESPWLFVRNYKAPHVFMGNEKAALEEWNWYVIYIIIVLIIVIFFVSFLYLAFTYN